MKAKKLIKKFDKKFNKDKCGDTISLNYELFHKWLKKVNLCEGYTDKTKHIAVGKERLNRMFRAKGYDFQIHTMGTVKRLFIMPIGLSLLYTAKTLPKKIISVSDTRRRLLEQLSAASTKKGIISVADATMLETAAAFIAPEKNPQIDLYERKVKEIAERMGAETLFITEEKK